MEHPTVIQPNRYAQWRPEKMGKATLFESERSGQYSLAGGGQLSMRAGELMVAPEGVAHGIRNTGTGRLLVLAVLAPAP